MYFYAILMAMGWNTLVYEPDSYYVPALVHEFYNVFSKFDISNYGTSFTLKWQGCNINIQVGTIPKVTGIVLGNGNLNSKVVEKFITMMGPNSKITLDHDIISTNDIINTMIYRNIYPMCC